MGRKIEPDVLATATEQAVPVAPATPVAATAASPGAEPAAAVKPVAAAAAAALADAGAAAAKAPRKSRPPRAATGTAAPAAAVKPAAGLGAGQAAKDAKAPRPEAAAEPVKQEKQDKAHAKPKLVRDSFTMPRADFALIAVLKDRALGFKRPVKKSELLRAGLHALAALDDVKLQAALAELTPLKAGRPKKG
ncbi:hypothetical protein [Azohydromonas aeria]|uniref:hypothetical protein n=1 Tax=Azohydromonas aeria TaxID=2590212 RepID=UPI0018DFC11A|nr:hypothetical protein [Azohydromonas aeria]